MTILAIDGMNMFHRARSGFKMGPAPVVFNFFRQLRSLVDKFQPTKVYIALEGRPVKRHEALAEYKANRKVEANDPRAEELAKFFAQKDVIVGLLTKHFPVIVVRHPLFEADDTLANIVRNSPASSDWVLVSSDTDFIQLVGERDNFRLYNPVKDEFVAQPLDYDYVTWKALRGDSSDNIPGVPGVGDKTAAKIASDPDKLKEFVSRPEVEPIFTRNYDLIRFAEWTTQERQQMTSTSPQKNWNIVKETFTGYGFTSIVKEGAWQKFTSTFEGLDQ